MPSSVFALRCPKFHALEDEHMVRLMKETPSRFGVAFYVPVELDTGYGRLIEMMLGIR